MAGVSLASRVPQMSQLLKHLPNSGKLLAVSSMNKIQTATMKSKTSGDLPKRLPPWNYKRWGFEYPHSIIDGTTKRFNENSKLVVVEGPPALGKTEVAKAIADEFDMLFIPGFTMEDYYINSYGYDLRDLDYRITHERVKSYDEKKFAQDPLGQDGGLDRMLWNLHMMRYFQYVDVLEHIFNTGQGVVTERSPFSDWIYFDAAYNQGWIDKTTKQHYWKMRNLTIDRILRPNMIIHLDAPTDVVQSKIRARSATTHPWEKNSPVWQNSEYIEEVYQSMFKNQYLPTASESSYVLQYDWSEGGDIEVVVEDMERLQMDYHDKYDKQQKDWRLHTEDGFASKRYLYTNKISVRNQFRDPFWSADKLILSAYEGKEAEVIRQELPGNYYRPGYNTELGDKEPLFNFNIFGGIKEAWYKDVPYFVDNFESSRDWDHQQDVRKSRKAAGDPDWWKAEAKAH